MTPTGPSPLLDPAHRRLSLAAMLANVFIMGLTFGLVVPILSVLLEHDGVPTWMIGLNGSMALLATFVLGPFVPSIVDRLGPVGAIVIGALLVCAGFLLLPVLRDVEVWFGLRFMVGIGMTLHWVTSLTWLNAVTPEHRRGLVNGINAALFSGGFATGPLIVTEIGIDSAAPFQISAALIGFSLVLLLLVRHLAPRLMIPRSERFKHLRAVLVAAPVVSAIAFIAGFGETGAGALIPVYGLRSGLAVEHAVLIIAAMTAGSVVLQFPLGWLADRLDRRLLLLALIAVGLSGAVLLPLLITSGPFLYLLIFFWGGAVMGLYALGLTMVGQRFGSGTLTHANAVFVMFYSMGSITGSSGAGIAMDLWDPHGLPALIGLGFLALLIYALSKRAAPGAEER